MKRPPLIQIELSSEVPAYEQIVSEIRALLVAGELRPGVQLPTVRQLAADLTAHRNTVAQAYRILSGEGWLDLRRGRGARVVSRPMPPRSGGTVQRIFRRQLKNLLAKSAAEGISPHDIARQLALHAREVRNSTPAKGGP